MLDAPLVSIIILTWNRCPRLIKTIEEVKKNDYPNTEIIVIDNGSKDNTSDYIRNNYPELKLITLPRNFGIEGFNWGFVNATGEYIFEIDDDSYPKDNAITKAVNALKIDNSIGIGACNTLYEAKKDNQLDFDNSTIVNGHYTYGYDKENLQELATFDGAGVIFRREFINKSGGYHKDFYIYGNEDYISLKCIELGYRIVFIKESVFKHDHSFRNLDKREKNKSYYGVRNTLKNIWIFYPNRFDKIIGLFIRLSKKAFKRRVYWSFLKGFITGCFSLFYVKERAIITHFPPAWEERINSYSLIVIFKKALRKLK